MRYVRFDVNVPPIFAATLHWKRHLPKFLWATLSIGKFTAPLLQELSPDFTEGVIGMTFALQYAIVACLAGWGGSYSDAQERKADSWGMGRLKVLSLFLTLGSLTFLGHCVPEYLKEKFPRGGGFLLLWHIAIRCIYGVSFGVTASCLDGLTLAHLACIEGASSVEFGVERMYGAIFWGVGSLAAGIGIDYFGFGFLYAALVIITLACYVSIGLYIWGLRRDTTGEFKSQRDLDERVTHHSSQNDQQEGPESAENTVGLLSAEVPGEKTGKVFSNSELLCMVCKTGYGRAVLFFTFALAMGIAVVDNLAFIFFDTLGASATMDGLTVVFTVIVEIPIFYVAPKLLERYGPGRLLLAAGIAYVIRVVGYTLVPDGKMFYIILGLESLHGISYAGSKTGSVEFINRMIPEGQEAAGQGILIFVTYLGVVAGLTLAGWMQEHAGARIMFRVMAAIVSIGLAVLLLAEISYAKEQSRNGTPEGDEHCHLIKSESAASTGSAFADTSTERYIRSLKYDSLGKNKYVKDW